MTHLMTRSWTRSLTVLAVSAVLLIAVPAIRDAGATVPGANGLIAFVRGGDIYVINVDGSGERNLTESTNLDQSPTWSPDGSRIAFSRSYENGSGISVINVDGSGLTNLTLPTADSDDESPAWSPDGTRLAVTRRIGPDWEVVVINADGSGNLNVSQNPTRIDYLPAWSPDGTKIAFTSRELLGSKHDIHIVDAAGTDQMNLTQSPASDEIGPAWLPDGSAIGFTGRLEPDASLGVYVMAPDGSDQRRISWGHSGEWSPDGRRIAFEGPGDEGADIYVMNSDGSLQTQITHGERSSFNPTWQPIPSSDLSLSAGTSPSSAKRGRPLTYGITLENAGPSNAGGVVVLDRLPPEARFVSVTAPGWSCVAPGVGATGTVSCSRALVPAGIVSNIQIVVTIVGKKALIQNGLNVTSATPDPNFSNNSVLVSTPVR